MKNQKSVSKNRVFDYTLLFWYIKNDRLKVNRDITITLGSKLNISNITRLSVNIGKYIDIIYYFIVPYLRIDVLS